MPLQGDHELFFHVSSVASCATTDSRRFQRGIFRALADMRGLLLEAVEAEEAAAARGGATAGAGAGAHAQFALGTPSFGGRASPAVVPSPIPDSEGGSESSLLEEAPSSAPPLPAAAAPAAAAPTASSSGSSGGGSGSDSSGLAALDAVTAATLLDRGPHVSVAPASTADPGPAALQGGCPGSSTGSSTSRRGSVSPHSCSS